MTKKRQVHSCFRIVSRVLPTLILLLVLPLLTFTPATGEILYYPHDVAHQDRGWDIWYAPHTVQPDDWVLRLFREKGKTAHTDFTDFWTAFYRLNPHVTDIHLIRPGQVVHIPLKRIQTTRGTERYAILFGDSEDEVKKAAGYLSADDPALPPTWPDHLSPPAKAADILGGQLLDQGAYYLPTKDGETVELDLSRYPMIKMPSFPKVVLFADDQIDDQIMGMDIQTIQLDPAHLKVACISKTASAGDIVQAVLSILEASPPPLTLSINGVNIQVTAQWIRAQALDNNQVVRHACMTFIPTPEQQTDPGMVRYLASQNVEIYDILPGQEGILTSPIKPTLPGFRTAKTGKIDGHTQKAVIEAFSRLMGFCYSPAVSISFPYAGIQVQAVSSLISFGNGKQALIDFGDLYGDAVEAIQNAGLFILQIPPDAGPVFIFEKLLDIGGINHAVQPVFYAAGRSAEFNTAIEVQGILVAAQTGNLFLFTDKVLPEPVTALVQDGYGIPIIQIGLPR
ncbi:hypothetical protein LJC71_04530 [Desulfosarcina sp. OttesenSCG-928-A07]|nr:hypothetical protein [Desulfosarcina sp. OttesenSCG-928-A07]